jgi:hypothetical protein
MNRLTLLLLVILLPLLNTVPLLAAQTTFIPRFSAHTEYTDNLNLLPSNEEGDITTSISAGFTAGVAGKYAGLSISYDPSYVFYETFEENNGWRHNASLDSFLNIAKNTRFKLADTFVLTEDPLSESQIAAIRAGEDPARFDPTIRTTRQQYWRNTVIASLTHQFSKDDSIYATYVYSILENEDPFVEDSQEHTGSAGLTYYFGPKWGVNLSGSYTFGSFDQTGSFVGTPTNDFDNWGGRLGLTRRFSKTTDGYLRYNYTAYDFGNTIQNYQVHDARIGIDYTIEQDISFSANTGYFVQDKKVSEDDDGILLDMALRKTLKRGGYRIEGGAGYDNVFFTAENLGFNVHYRIGVTADYELIRRFWGDIYGAYRLEDYRNQTRDREDNIYRAGGGFTWTPTLWANIRVGYSFRRVDSTNPFNTYSENRVLLTIFLSPERPFRALY